jgi:tetratricopeptide (TPR) repeat protein
VIAGFYNRQGDFDKTMEAFNARAEIEAANPEAWHTIGTFYQDKVFRDKTLSRGVARDFVLAGIEAEDKALALNPNYAEALIFKNILLRQQALYESDPAVQRALIAEADSLRDRGMAIMEEQTAAAAAEAAATAGGTSGGGSGGGDR